MNQSAERLLTEKFEANQKDEFIIVDKARDLFSVKILMLFEIENFEFSKKSLIRI